MTSRTTTDHAFAAASSRDNGFLRQAMALLLGAGFTFGLFMGIAHYEKETPATPPAILDELHVALPPIEPPPLPVKPVESVQEITPMMGFDLAPSSSPVKIAVSPPSPLELLPENLSKTPVANAQTGPMLTEFKPKTDLLPDGQRIYQKSDVDRIPSLLDRTDPVVPSRMMDDNPMLRVTILMVIELDGSTSHIRLTKTSGIAEFDQLMIESVKNDWVFAPAIKRGKKVRCLIEQAISVRKSSGSRFGI